MKNPDLLFYAAVALSSSVVFTYHVIKPKNGNHSIKLRVRDMIDDKYINNLLGNSNLPYCKTKNPIELKRCKMPRS